LNSTRPCTSCDHPVPADAAFCPACGLPSASPILGETLIGVSRATGSAASYELAPERLQSALGPHYELGRLIGRGGYAEVFAVRDLRLKRELALKVLRPDLILTDTLAARFRREAEAVAVLLNPHIVPVYDVGEADGILWLLMPLVQGETVKSLLARERRIPVEEVRRILLEAATALQTAHEAGVVHRDIKPENLMIEGKSQRVLLMDFGIAKAMDSSIENSLTGTGVVIGTPQYMSPEQAMGKQAPDPRSDQYSLAVVGYQMLTGRVPFEGDNVREVMVKQMLEEPTPLSRLVDGIPSSMSATIHQALRKDPKHRFTSMSAFARSLAGEMVAPSEGGKVQREASFNIPDRRRPWIAAAGWVVVLSGAAFALTRAGVFPAVPPPTPPPAIDTAGASPVVRPARPAPSPPPAATPGQPVVAAVKPVDSAATAVPPPAPAATCESAFSAADWPAAFALCSADSTNPVSHRHLGLLYSEGRGVEKNERLAALHLLLAADSTDVIAVMEMARRYEAGRGVTASQERAARKYLTAAHLGVKEAYAIVARRYEAGLGFEKSPTEAVRWFAKSAEEVGDAVSMTRLAAAYASGKGIRKDESLAVRWYNLAAAKQDPEAEYQLAMMLLRGKGGMREDLAAGKGWLKRAVDHGHAEAIKEWTKRGW
jgi:tRNA A-37 threonylcarbamoyl transferase component Bud32